jgi:hypothetical protein
MQVEEENKPLLRGNKPNTMRAQKIVDPHITSRLVGNETSRIKRNKISETANPRVKKYNSKTYKNIHRDLIGFARTKRKSRKELIGGATTGPKTAQPGTIEGSSITKQEYKYTMGKRIARATGLRTMANAVGDTFKKIGAFVDTKNPMASEILNIEIAGREFIDTCMVYKAYLIRIRQALVVIDKKILTPIIIGSMKGKKGGGLFNDGNNPMIHESTLKYLYRLANLRDNTYLDYIGKCSMSSLEGVKSRIKSVVDFFKRATTNLKPIDRYSGLRFKFFMCKLYKLREAELEYNFRLQQLSQHLKFISNSTDYLTLQKYLKFRITKYNSIEYLDIRKTEPAFNGYNNQLMSDLKNQKINEAAVDLEDSALSKEYYKTLETIPANIERVKYVVNKCIQMSSQIVSLQTEIHRSTGLAPNDELNFVMRGASIKRLKDQSFRQVYFDKLNDINYRVDNYVQYLLESIDAAINYGEQENTTDKTYENIANLRGIVLFLDKYLNSLSTMDQATFMKLRDEIKQYLLNKLAATQSTTEYMPTHAKQQIDTIFAKIKNPLIIKLLEADNKNLLFKNKGLLYEIWGDDTTLARKLLFHNDTYRPFDLQDMRTLLGKMRDYYTRQIVELTGGQQSVDIQSAATLGATSLDKSTARIKDYRAGIPSQQAQIGGAELADFSSEPNESYPVSMNILPFGYPDDLPSTTSPTGCPGQVGGVSFQLPQNPNTITITDEKSKAQVLIRTSAGDKTEEFRFLRLSNQTLQAFYGDMLYMMNYPMFLESRSFFKKILDFFTRATKIQRTKQVHRIYMNYLIKLEMGVINFLDETPDGQYPSRFPDGTAVNGYPAFVLMKLYWEYVELTESTNYSDFSLLHFKDFIEVRAKADKPENRITREGIKFKYDPNTQPEKYKDMVTKFFGNAATSNYRKGAGEASIPLSFLQIGLLNQDEILTISNLNTFNAIKKTFDSAVFKMVNARINQIRQNDNFIKASQEIGKQYKIRAYTPPLQKLLDELELAYNSSSRDLDLIDKLKTKLLPYLKPRGNTNPDISMYYPEGSTNVKTIGNISNNIYDYLADADESYEIFEDNAFVDFTPDINAMIMAVSIRYSIGWALTGGLGCNRFKYKSPDEIITAYEGGDSIPAISGISDSNTRRTAFNSYPPHVKNYIRNMIRAKFSMLRATDYNDTYFPMDKNGNINQGEITKYEFDVTDLGNFKDKSTTGKVAAGLSSGKALYIFPITKWILKLGLSIFSLGASIFLAPALYALVSVFAADEAADPNKGNAETKKWYESIIKILGLPVIGPAMLVWGMLKKIKDIYVGDSIAAQTIKKIAKALWTNMPGVEDVDKVGKFIKTQSGANYELLRLFIQSISSDSSDIFDSELRDYNLDKMEFAIAYSHIGNSGNDINSTAAQVLCYYLSQYYANDTENLQSFQNFFADLKKGSEVVSDTDLIESTQEQTNNAVLFSLVRDLIGKTDSHTQAVFKEMLSVSDDWNEAFEFDDLLSMFGGDVLNISDDILMKIYKTTDPSKYYENPDNKLSLLLQLLKLQGCVRLLGCLHIIYDQHKLLSQKMSQIANFNKGIAKDVKLDALGELYRQINNKTLNPGSFGDLNRVMETCGINLIQYYRTKLMDMISASRIELTGETNKAEAQTVFNRALTKMLMFLRLNYLFGDYIQFKTRYIPNPASVKNKQKQLVADWDKVFNFELAGSKTKPIEFKFNMTVFEGSMFPSTGSVQLILTSPYMTYQSLIPSFGTKTTSKYEYKLPIPDSTDLAQLYYYDGARLAGITRDKISQITNIIAFVYVDGTNINLYFNKSVSITQQKFYDSDKLVGASIFNVLSKYRIAPPAILKSAAGGTKPKAVSFAGSTTSKSIEQINLANDGNTLYYIDPYYPTRPYVSHKYYKVSSPPIYFHPARGSGHTHNIWNDAAKTNYYSTVFPTLTKLRSLATPPASSLNIPTSSSFTPSGWTYSDFIWTVPPIKAKLGGGARAAKAVQIGGAIDQAKIVELKKPAQSVVDATNQFITGIKQNHPSDTQITQKSNEITNIAATFLDSINKLDATKDNLIIKGDIDSIIGELGQLVIAINELSALVQTTKLPTAKPVAVQEEKQELDSLVKVLQKVQDELGKISTAFGQYRLQLSAQYQNSVEEWLELFEKHRKSVSEFVDLASGIPVSPAVQPAADTKSQLGQPTAGTQAQLGQSLPAVGTQQQQPAVATTTQQQQPAVATTTQQQQPAVATTTQQQQPAVATTTQQHAQLGHEKQPGEQQANITINTTNITEIITNVYHSFPLLVSSKDKSTESVRPEDLAKLIERYVNEAFNKQNQPSTATKQAPTAETKPAETNITPEDLEKLKTDLDAKMTRIINTAFEEMTTRLLATPPSANNKKAAKPSNETKHKSEHLTPEDVANVLQLSEVYISLFGSEPGTEKPSTASTASTARMAELEKKLADFKKATKTKFVELQKDNTEFQSVITAQATIINNLTRELAAEKQKTDENPVRQPLINPSEMQPSQNVFVLLSETYNSNAATTKSTETKPTINTEDLKQRQNQGNQEINDRLSRLEQAINGLSAPPANSPKDSPETTLFNIELNTILGAATNLMEYNESVMTAFELNINQLLTRRLEVFKEEFAQAASKPEPKATNPKFVYINNVEKAESKNKSYDEQIANLYKLYTAQQESHKQKLDRLNGIIAGLLQKQQSSPSTSLLIPTPQVVVVPASNDPKGHQILLTELQRLQREVISLKATAAQQPVPTTQPTQGQESLPTRIDNVIRIIHEYPPGGKPNLAQQVLPQQPQVYFVGQQQQQMPELNQQLLNDLLLRLQKIEAENEQLRRTASGIKPQNKDDSSANSELIKLLIESQKIDRAAFLEAISKLAPRPVEKSDETKLVELLTVLMKKIETPTSEGKKDDKSETELRAELARLRAEIDALSKSKTPEKREESIKDITEISTRSGMLAKPGFTVEQLLKKFIYEYFSHSRTGPIPAPLYDSTGTKSTTEMLALPAPEETKKPEELKKLEESKKVEEKAKELSRQAEYMFAKYEGTPSIIINIVASISEMLGKITSPNPSLGDKYQYYFVVGSIDKKGAIQYIITPRLDFTGKLPGLSQDIQIIYLAIPSSSGSGPNIYCRYVPDTPTPVGLTTADIYSEISTIVNANTTKYPYIIIS